MTLRAKLIDVNTGKEVFLHPGNKILIIKHGPNKGTSFKVGEVIYPSETYPEGLIKSTPMGTGWQQLLPSVFDIRIEVTDGTDAPDT